MRKQCKALKYFFLKICIFLTAFSLLFPEATYSEAPHVLCTGANEPESGSGDLPQGAIRVRNTLIDPDVITVNRLALNLYFDVQLYALMRRVDYRATGDYTWIGDIEGDPVGYAVLVVKGSNITANIVAHRLMYQIRPERNGIHNIYTIRQCDFPDEKCLIPPMGLRRSASTVMSSAVSDDGSLIDVLVVYTDDVALAVPDVMSLIRLAFDEANLSYENSNIRQRLRLVHAEEVSYRESGDSCKDVERLQDPSDKKLDEVHDMRDFYCADVVSLWVEDGGWCGCGYLMEELDPVYEAEAFSCVARRCATGYYSFGHELGHNMGAQHDRYVGGDGVFEYSHGFVNLDDRWRTIMAYDRQCDDNGYDCTRLPYWSNPYIYYGGYPMGIPDPDPDSADNARTLDETALTVANYRLSCIATPTRTPTDTPTRPWTPTPSSTPTRTDSPTSSPTITTTITPAFTFTPILSPTRTAIPLPVPVVYNVFILIILLSSVVCLALCRGRL